MFKVTTSALNDASVFYNLGVLRTAPSVLLGENVTPGNVLYVSIFRKYT
jgi:hypothetical protein